MQIRQQGAREALEWGPLDIGCLDGGGSEPQGPEAAGPGWEVGVPGGMQGVVVAGEPFHPETLGVQEEHTKPEVPPLPPRGLPPCRPATVLSPGKSHQEGEERSLMPPGRWLLSGW